MRARLAFMLCLAVAGVATISVPRLTLSYTGNATVTIPQLLLGTGGGNGGFDALQWLEEGGAGFDTAQTYCYFTTPTHNGTPAAACSQVAIANAVSLSSTSYSSQFIISKLEPEDFGALDVFSGFGRVFDRGILQEMTLPVLDMLMFHQSGRGQGASNVRPPCFDPAGAATGEGTYAKCRLATFQGFLQLQRQGLIRATAVSNWQIRDLQQVHAATGVFPSALEVEVHPFWHEDALLDFCLANNITVISAFERPPRKRGLPPSPGTPPPTRRLCAPGPCAARCAQPPCSGLHCKSARHLARAGAAAVGPAAHAGRAHPAQRQRCAHAGECARVWPGAAKRRGLWGAL